MSLFSRLFKEKPAIELHDSVFGHITFERGIWAYLPNPPTEGFMITIDAPESGPAEEQRVLFQQIRERLAEFEQRARDVMQSRVDEEIDVGQLATYSVEIGASDETARRGFVLELSDPDAIVIHRVTFRGDEAVYDGFDD